MQLANISHFQRIKFHTVKTYLLDAWSRDNINLSLAVLVEIEKTTSAEDVQWQLRIERAQIDAERARRQFDRVKPENRIVARNLEHRWNEALANLECLNQEYRSTRERNPLHLSDAQRKQIMALTKDLKKMECRNHNRSRPSGVTRPTDEASSFDSRGDSGTPS